LILALAVFDSFQEHFKHDQYGLIKLVASFSVACIGALLLRFGVENELVASGISWLLMTVIILAGIAWATFQAAVPKNLSSSIGTNTPENRNHK